MASQNKWQFSIRSMAFLMLALGPLAGALSGTFGAPVQEIFIMLLVWALTSVLLAIVSMLLACVIVSPLLILDRVLRRWDQRAAARQRGTLPEKRLTE